MIVQTLRDEGEEHEDFARDFVRDDGGAEGSAASAAGLRRSGGASAAVAGCWLVGANSGAVVGNASLGFSTLLALYLNRAMLPKELRPRLLLQFCVLAGGLFFLGMATLVFVLFFL